MRTPIMAGNWKMNCDNEEAAALAKGVVDAVGQVADCQVVLCPPATALTTVAECIKGSKIQLGAQNMFWEEKGAFTGELSAKMLLSCGCSFVIIGHSERRGRFGAVAEDFTEELRRVFGDTDASVNRKLKAALAAGLTPIVCVGELISERQAGMTDAIVSDQVRAALDGVEADALPDIVIAYEPVWAIGTGEVCDAQEANRVCGLIRKVVGDIGGASRAEAMRVLYGGSVKPDNIDELIAQPEIDGGLVGGASLKADSFAALVNAAAK